MDFGGAFVASFFLACLCWEKISRRPTKVERRLRAFFAVGGLTYLHAQLCALCACCVLCGGAATKEEEGTIPIRILSTIDIGIDFVFASSTTMMAMLSYLLLPVEIGWHRS